jgi:hypothetical protein
MRSRRNDEIEWRDLVKLGKFSIFTLQSLLFKNS